MKCEAVRELLTQYVLGDLSKALASEVWGHLHGCDGCRAAVREIEPTLDLLRDALAAPSGVPQQLSSAHKARIMRARPQQARRKTLIPPPEFPSRTGRVIRWFGKGHFVLARVAIYLVLAGIVAGMFLPAVSSSRDKARRTSDMSDLSQIGKAVAMYSMDHEEAMPESLEDLKPYMGGDDETFNKLTTSHDGRRYNYRGKELTAGGSSDEPVAVDVKENGGNVLYLDGSVTWMNGDELQEVLPKFQEDGQATTVADEEETSVYFKPPRKSLLSRLGEQLKGRRETLKGPRDVASAPPASPVALPSAGPEPVAPGGGGYSYQGTATEPTAESVPADLGVGDERRRERPEEESKKLGWDKLERQLRVAETTARSGSEMKPAVQREAPAPAKPSQPATRLRQEARQEARRVARPKAAEEMVTESYDVLPSVVDKFADISASISAEDDNGFGDIGGDIGRESGGFRWEAPAEDELQAELEEPEFLEILPGDDLDVEMDEVKIVKSPIIMKGIYGSRSPGARGSIVGRHGGAARGDGPDVDVEMAEAEPEGAGKYKSRAKDDETDYGSHPFFSDRASDDKRYETVQELDVLSQGVVDTDKTLGAYSYDPGKDVAFEDREQHRDRIEELKGKFVIDGTKMPRDGVAAEGGQGDRDFIRVTPEAEGQDAERFSITLSEVPLKDVASMMSEISGRKVVAAPGTDLKGTVTADLGAVDLATALESYGLAFAEPGPDGDELAEQDGEPSDLIGISAWQDGPDECDYVKNELAKLEEKKELEEDQTGPRFKAVGVNPFYEACERPFSTFAIDVDTAAYTLARNYMHRGFLPPAESVRTEEFVNFFDYAYRAPEKGTFQIYAECAPAPFGRGLHLMKIGVKGRRIGREEKKSTSLMFVIDTSGSMNTPDRIELVKKSLRMLLDKLAPQDKVAIVQFGSKARLVLDYTAAAEKQKILDVINQMQTTGSTNLEEAMRLAYQIAARGFTGGAVNRVLIMSDGAANIGTGAAEDILAEVEKYRKQGIYCSVFGFGMGTYNDEMLETLANKGDGAYTFIDSEDEARRVFVDDLGATLNTIAADVKIQVEFNPDMVTRYRQLGYENRQLTKEQFRDDTVDAGEVGSGQSVTALYELGFQRSEVSLLRQGYGGQGSQRSESPLIAVVRVRYRRLDTGAVEEIEKPLRMSNIANSVDDMDCRFRLAACAAEFAEILRGSPYAEGSDYNDVSRLLEPVALELNVDTRVQELRRMVNGAGGMSRAPIGE